MILRAMGVFFESPSGVLILVGYHELIAVYLHLCVVPVSIVSGLEDGILQLNSTAREWGFNELSENCERIASRPAKGAMLDLTGEILV